MKQTEHFGFQMMEAADLLSAKPLNENAAAMDAALQEQKNAILARLMMATGSYTGDGRRSVAIQTPGFKPQVVLMTEGGSMNSFWFGEDFPVTYEVYACVDEDNSYGASGELRKERVTATATFTSEMGSVSWSIPPLPEKYYDVVHEYGAEMICNHTGRTYRWIAFGTAE